MPACASHFLTRPRRARLAECGQAVRSRAAFALTHDHVRKHMFGCTRDADLAGRVSSARLDNVPSTTRGANGRLCKSRKKCLRRARTWRAILFRWRHAQARDASTLDFRERRLVCTRHQIRSVTTTIFHAFGRTPKPSHDRRNNPNDPDLHAFAICPLPRNCVDTVGAAQPVSNENAMRVESRLLQPMAKLCSRFGY